MAMKKQVELRNIGFRNAKLSILADLRHQGKDQQGLGIVIDDMYLMCLTSWVQNQFNGPTVLLYPHREIFYGYFRNQVLAGPWSFSVDRGDEIIQMYGVGPLPQKRGDRSIIAVCSRSQISKIQLQVQESSKTIQTQFLGDEDLALSSSQQSAKWSIIEKILKTQFQPTDRNLFNFLQFNFHQKQEKQGSFSMISMDSNREILCKLNGPKGEHESLGFMLQVSPDKSEIRLKNLGTFLSQSEELECGQRNLEYGRKFIYVSDDSIKIIEGIFNTEEAYQYMEQADNDGKSLGKSSASRNPEQSLRTSRKYFRKSTEFTNQYIYFSEADYLFQMLMSVMGQYVTHSTKKQGEVLFRKRSMESLPYREPTQQQQYHPQYEHSEKRRRGGREKNTGLDNIRLFDEEYGQKRQYELHEAKQIIEKEIAIHNRGHAGRLREGSLSNTRKSPAAHLGIVEISHSRSRQHNHYSSRSPSRKYEYLVDQAKRRTSPTDEKPKEKHYEVFDHVRIHDFSTFQRSQPPSRQLAQPHLNDHSKNYHLNDHSRNYNLNDHLKSPPKNPQKNPPKNPYPNDHLKSPLYEHKLSTEPQNAELRKFTPNVRYSQVLKPDGQYYPGKYQNAGYRKNLNYTKNLAKQNSSHSPLPKSEALNAKYTNDSNRKGKRKYNYFD